MSFIFVRPSETSRRSPSFDSERAISYIKMQRAKDLAVQRSHRANERRVRRALD